MRCISKIFIILLVFSLVSTAYAEDNKPGPLNLKVGENFYFEGNIVATEADSKEESIAEIKHTPFYETTWFIALTSIAVVAGASTAVYFLTQEEESEGKVVTWGN